MGQPVREKDAGENKKMSTFLHNAAAFLSALDVEHYIDLPFVHFPQRQVSFHLNPLAPCNEPLYFQELSVNYEQQGIRLIQLWEDVWNRQQKIVEARIHTLLGNAVRIFARHTTAARINKTALDGFMMQNHLHGSPQAKYKYGLCRNNVLVAAASFSACRPMLRHGKPYDSYELIRFASLASHTVVGGLSKLLAQFVHEVHPGDIMSYADRDWSTGWSYEQLGFTFAGNTPPQAFLIHPDEQIRYYPHRLPNGTTAETLRRKGYFTIYNAGNKKYVKLMC
ncbi:MAG: hypothetical protein LBF39_01625 [Prevotellaceae bacterium]|jgi:hypothetical protein|nr:hypothetical protein [Prevotellaceae bacterium]